MAISADSAATIYAISVAITTTSRLNQHFCPRSLEQQHMRIACKSRSRHNIRYNKK